MTSSKARLIILTPQMIGKKGDKCKICPIPMGVNTEIVIKLGKTFNQYHVKCARSKNII